MLWNAVSQMATSRCGSQLKLQLVSFSHNIGTKIREFMCLFSCATSYKGNILSCGNQDLNGKTT